MLLKKSLGQHILMDGHILGRIVSAAEIVRGERCLEIGPGTGALTRGLLAAGAHVTAVELDDRFAAELPGRVPDEHRDRLQVVHDDFLKLDLKELFRGQGFEGESGGDGSAQEFNSNHIIKVVANLPYNIASAVIIKLLEHPGIFGAIFALMQNEVAERIAAPAGSPQRSSLSVFCQTRAHASLLFKVPPEAFAPPPKVESRLIRLIPSPGISAGIGDMKVFDAIVRGAFEHKRKTCYNSLRLCPDSILNTGFLPGAARDEFFLKVFARAGVPVTLRAHQLDAAQWTALADSAADIIKNPSRKAEFQENPEIRK